MAKAIFGFLSGLDGLTNFAELYAGPATISILATHAGFRKVVAVELNERLRLRARSNFKLYAHSEAEMRIAKLDLRRNIPLAHADVVFANPPTARTNVRKEILGYYAHVIIQCLACLKSHNGIIINVVTESTVEVYFEIVKSLKFLAIDVLEVEDDNIAEIYKRHPSVQKT